MTVTINAKGTSATSFKIGKRGTTLHQGTSVDPATVPQGDFWFDALMGSLRYKGTEPSSWRNLVFDDISFVNNSIISVTGDSTISLNGDIVLTPSSTGDVILGTNGTPVITTQPGESLSIEPDVYLFLNGMRFPVADGTVGQVLTTNGAGVLGWSAAAVFNSSFDSREIVDPAPIKSALAINKKIKPISYTEPKFGTKKLGFVANELQTIFPFAVSGKKDEKTRDGKDIPQAVDTTVFFAHLVACVQELTDKLAKAEAKIAKLEKKNP